MSVTGALVRPAITVVLPVRNGASTIARALGSILTQTCDDWELLVLDDRSRDDTRRIARGLACADPRVRVLEARGPGGRVARLAQGIAAARGEFLARMDADDVAYPERFERQLNFLRSNADVDLVGSSMLVFGDRGLVRGVRIAPAAHAAIAGSPHHGLKLFHPTWFGRIAWFRQHGYRHRSAWCEDQLLLFDASGSSCYANLPEPLLGYRENDLRLGPILGGRADFAAVVARESLRDRRAGAAATAVLGQVAKAGVDVVALTCGLGSTLHRHRARPTTPDVVAEWEAVWCQSLDSWRALELVQA
jgi:glycosyltransferase involved in cell wall biosynthesis